MAEKKRKIIIVNQAEDEDFTAAQVAEEAVKKVVKSANVMDAVSTMETAFEPDETSVLSNDEFGLVFAEMTDQNAAKLAKEPGVEAVEDDEKVYAFEDFGDDFMGDGDSDEEAAQLIDEAMDVFDDYSDEDLEFITPEMAALEAQQCPVVDDIDIDDNGQVVSLDDVPAPPEQLQGIPIDKVWKIVRCVIKCAIEEFGGRTEDVTDEKISEILAEEGVPGAASTAQSIRDYITCGLRIIYAPYAWRYSLGAGVRVAVVDTGITPRHPDLRVYGGASFVPGVTRWTDDHYHGTHVAGTIAALLNGRGVVGVAPRAQLYAVKVLNRNGSGYSSWILNGLAWCMRARMNVVNLSLGSGATTHNPRSYSRAYEQAGGWLRRYGILPVAAAGNSGRTTRPFVGNPARCPSFMAVSAIDCRRRRASFSSYGPQVEICAPGVSVWSTVPPNRYHQLNGTSMAAPHVSGVAALVKARHPSWRGDTIRVWLWRTALDLGAPGRDWFYGFGQVNAYRAVR